MSTSTAVFWSSWYLVGGGEIPFSPGRRGRLVVGHAIVAEHESPRRLTRPPATMPQPVAVTEGIVLGALLGHDTPTPLDAGTVYSCYEDADRAAAELLASARKDADLAREDDDTIAVPAVRS